MKKLVLGSLNIDRTYRVDTLVRPKETIAAKSYESFCGGKGFNQAIALARAENEVWFAGVVGHDGDMLLEALAADGVKTDYIRRSESPNGHAVIQVDESGQNCIIIVSGSNAEITEAYIDELFLHFSAGDLLLLQNEVSCVDYAIEQASRKGLIVALNPSPFDDTVRGYDLSRVDILLVNEVEGAQMCGSDNEDHILEKLHERYPAMSIVLTMGENGSAYMDRNGKKYRAAAVRCEAVDTTAAGDTFTGYFLGALSKNDSPASALELAAIASGISVTRKGAAQSIPSFQEVLRYTKESPRSVS